jgi:serine/threonine protein kinase/tetratricopeptide (TPR) repeat protein
MASSVPDGAHAPTLRMYELAEQLVVELGQAWQRGERTTAEELLARHTELSSEPEVAVRVVYEEFCLRIEAGEEVKLEDFRQRFPQWWEKLAPLLECHPVPPPGQPAVGPVIYLGEFELVAPLGRGARGTVYLATQPALGGRPVVLKITPCTGQEHVTLARLQHTHIMPLYSLRDDAQRNLRTLCMPYFGGATLAQLLTALQKIPVAARTGRDLVDALDRAQRQAPVAAPSAGPARQLLARASYAQAVCWLGTCLADALHFAHEHGLVHLDVKPHNVLITATGQPMLLDFDIARRPLRCQDSAAGLGATPCYASPEQWAALEAKERQAPIPQAVERHSDIYSLGVVLYEALGGPLRGPRPRLDQCNAQVSPGLADVLAKCLTAEPARRYASAADLATDLRRHVADLPLQGVPNRSLRERWRKWRRRRPHALAGALLIAAVLGAALSLIWIVTDRLAQDRRQAEAALALGQQHLHQREHSQAVAALTQGLTLVESVPGSAELTRDLSDHLQRAQRGVAADQLHALADRLRYLCGAESGHTRDVQALAARWQEVWQTRQALLDRSAGALDQDLEERLQGDLLDLGLIWADFRLRRLPSGGAAADHEETMTILEQTRELAGDSIVLCRLRHACALALGRQEEAAQAARQAADLKPRTGWEHCALARWHLQAGDLEAAAAALSRALAANPRAFWPTFYEGICAYRRGRYHEALTAFRVCLVLEKRSVESYFNRGLAHAALDQPEQAAEDFSRALELQPKLGSAALQRARAYYELQRYPESAADLRTALDNGADPVQAHYQLALVYLQQDNHFEALRSTLRVLDLNPRHAEARELERRLTSKTDARGSSPGPLEAAQR